MKAYKFVYVFDKKEDIYDIRDWENIKHGGVSEEEAKEIAEFCIVSIKSYYANYSEEYAGFLRKFAYTRLESGNLCLCRLEGKENQYAASTLIIKDGCLPFYPIQLFGSDIFSNEEKLNTLFSGELSAKLKPTPGTSFERVSAFIKGRGDYSLRNMLDILLDTNENPVAIKIIDKLENVLLWIAALQMAFPVEIAHSLFFFIDTSSTDFTECIIATENIGEAKEYTFNFVTGRISRGINEFRLTRLVEMGYIISAETINAFHKFLSKFSCKKFNNELEKCYKLFNMINFGLGNTENEDLGEALEFAGMYSSQAVLEELFEGFQLILTKIEYDLNFEKVKLLSEFMYKTAVNSREKIYLDRTNDFFFGFTDKYIMKVNILNGEEFFDFYEDIKKTAGRNSDRIISHSVSIVRLKQIADFLSKEEHPLQAELYMCMIIKDLIASRYSWNKAMHIEGFEEFIKVCTLSLSTDKSNHDQIFGVIGGNVDYLSHVSLLIYNILLQRGKAEDFISSFSRCISEKSPEFSVDARDSIYEIDINTSLLFEEFIFNLRQSSNKPECFWSSFRYGQGEIPGYFKKYVSEAIKAYLPLLSGEHLPVECKKLIRFILDRDIEADKETLRYIIKEYENILKLTEPSEEEYGLIRDIDKIKNKMYISTTPDITGIITFAMWVSNPGMGHRLSLKEVLEECPDFRKMDNRYIEFLSWCIPHIIEYAEVSDDHKQIVDRFCREGDEEGFFSLYLDIIEKRCLQNKSSGYSKVLNFLLSYYYYILPGYVYMGEENLIENMNQKISELLEGEYIRNINDLDKDLTYEFQKRELSVPVMWKDVFTKSKEKRANPIFNQVRKLFGKKG